MTNRNPPRDARKETGRAASSPNVARRTARNVEDDDAMVDDTPPGAGRREVNPVGTAVQPEGFQPLRNVGDTDQGDRQPDGGRRR